nr:hypothetical protein GZ27G5_36 [uncultured archaeon GZfos27G5]
MFEVFCSLNELIKLLEMCHNLLTFRFYQFHEVHICHVHVPFDASDPFHQTYPYERIKIVYGRRVSIAGSFTYVFRGQRFSGCKEHGINRAAAFCKAPVHHQRFHSSDSMVHVGFTPS